MKINISDIIKWIKNKKLKFINARRIAKEFNTDPRLAGKILSYLSKLGVLKLYKKRKGRFSVYKVNRGAVDLLELTKVKLRRKKRK